MVKKTKAKRVVKRKVKAPQRKITAELATKVLEVVDVGLVHGLGQAAPGHMCVEAAVCYAMGESHNDRPSCVNNEIAETKITLNDHHLWGYNLDEAAAKAARSKGLRRLAIAQLGSKGKITDEQWEKALRQYLWDKMSKAERSKIENARVATKQKLQAALLDLENDESFTVSIDYNSFNDGADVYDIFRHPKSVKDLNKLAEDLVQLLVKLKSPGTKYLYLTKKRSYAKKEPKTYKSILG